MIDSESRSQVRPLESLKRSRFELLAIASVSLKSPQGRQMSVIAMLRLSLLRETSGQVLMPHRRMRGKMTACGKRQSAAEGLRPLALRC